MLYSQNYTKSKIVRKISLRKGCLLLIDYGYLNPNNQNTLQSVMKHKKNDLLSKTNLVYLILLDNSETKVLTYQV